MIRKDILPDVWNDSWRVSESVEPQLLPLRLDAL